MGQPVKTLSTIVALGTLLLACSSSAVEESDAPVELDSRELLVLVSDLTPDDVIAAELLAEELDMVLLQSNDDGCDPEHLPVPEAIVTCHGSELARAASRTSGHVTVVAAAELTQIAQLEPELLARFDIVTPFPPDDEALVALVSSVTVVPSTAAGDEAADIFEQIAGRRPSDADLAMALTASIALDDTLAAFEVAPSTEGRQRTATSVDLERVSGAIEVEAAPPTPSATLAEELDGESIPKADVLWQVEIGVQPSGLHSQSKVIGPRVFLLGYDGTFRAIDRETGVIDWSFDIAEGAGATHASVVTGDDRLVVTNTGASPPPIPDVPGRRGVFAFEPASGEPLWSFESDQGGVSGHPLLAEDTVYFWFSSGPDDSAFLAVDALSGDTKWRTEAVWGAGQARFHDGVVYAGSSSGTLYGFDVETGEIVFEFFSPGASAVGFGVASRPAAADRTVYFGTDDGDFQAVDIDTAVELWSFDVGKVSLPSSPTVAENLVIFGAWDEAVHALDRFTGESVWRAATGTPVLSSPELAGDTIVVGTGRQLRGLDASSGESLWRHETQDWITDSPAIDDDSIYIQSRGLIEAVRPPTR